MKVKKSHYMLKEGEQASKILASSKVLGDDRILLVLRIMHCLHLACSISNGTGKQSHRCASGREDLNLPNKGVSTTLAMLFISLCVVCL